MIDEITYLETDSEKFPQDKRKFKKRKSHEESGSIIDFSWILFVGTKILGFTEKEVGHFTFKKWDLLYTHFKTYHNFCISKQLFAEKGNATHQTSDECIP
ncbi:MAG: hypothetical protein ACI4PR_05220 [Acutalibacteraceae bacterium]